MKAVQKLILPDRCSGCGACVQICPYQVLGLNADKEGFLVPSIYDIDKCIDCGVCIKVCQIHQVKGQNLNNEPPISFIAQSKDIKNVKRSASGGAFWTIAKDWIISKHGVVYGAAFDNNLVVRHIGVHTISDLKKLQGSKYVQSNTFCCYKEVKELLQAGQYILFSGTPCQVHGLKLYLRKEYTNLFTIDIICHGVTSPGLLRDYVEKVEKHEGRTVNNIRFRWKNPLFKSGSSFCMMMKMGHGFSLINAGKNDPYMNVYLSGYAFRESCYNCQFANPQRVGDITIGDCDSHQDYPGFHPTESNSTLILNTAQGKDYWNVNLHSFFDYTSLNLEREITCNKQLHKSFMKPIQRNGIYSQFYSMGYEGLVEHFGRKQTFVTRVKTVVMMFIPLSIKKVIAFFR